MFWVGDSSRGWRYWYKNLHREFLAGLRDEIPKCCILTYMICIVLCLGARTLTLRGRDGIVFWLFYWRYMDFVVTDYWRCPLCKLRGRRAKIRWDTRGYS